MKREAEIVLYDHYKEIGRRTFLFKIRMNRARSHRIISNAEDIFFGYPQIDNGEGGRITKEVIEFPCGITWTPTDVDPQMWSTSDHLTFCKGKIRLGVDARINFNKLLKA